MAGGPVKIRVVTYDAQGTPAGALVVFMTGDSTVPVSGARSLMRKRGAELRLLPAAQLSRGPLEASERRPPPRTAGGQVRVRLHAAAHRRWRHVHQERGALCELWRVGRPHAVLRYGTLWDTEHAPQCSAPFDTPSGAHQPAAALSPLPPLPHRRSRGSAQAHWRTTRRRTPRAWARRSRSSTLASSPPTASLCRVRALAAV